MTQDEQVARLCLKYSALASMDAANLARRIKCEALGSSDPATLADKLVALKTNGNADPKGAEDEQIWSRVMLKHLAATSKAQPKIEAKPELKPAKKPEAE